MRFRIGAAAVLHIKILVHGVVHAVVHARTQFERAYDFVLFAIHECDRVGIASVGDDKAVGLGQKSHRQRLGEALDTMDPLSCLEVKHFDGLLILRGKEQAVTLKVDSKMIEITRETRHWSGRNQFQRQPLLCLHEYRTRNQHQHPYLDCLSHVSPWSIAGLRRGSETLLNSFTVPHSEVTRKRSLEQSRSLIR